MVTPQDNRLIVSSGPTVLGLVSWPLHRKLPAAGKFQTEMWLMILSATVVQLGGVPVSLTEPFDRRSKVNCERVVTALGLACRPVGAWRRHLVKQFTVRRIGRGTGLVQSAGWT